MADAAAASTIRLNAMMPPNADVGSVANAFRYAASGESASATPHGFACFTITQAHEMPKPAATKLFTHSHAASASAMLLYDSSLPCSWRHVARVLGAGAASR